MITATRAQTEATFKQTETTVRLELRRDASEALAFHAMLAAAMARVLAEAAWARETYPHLLTPQTAGASPRGPWHSAVHNQGRVRGITLRVH